MLSEAPVLLPYSADEPRAPVGTAGAGTGRAPRAESARGPPDPQEGSRAESHMQAPSWATFLWCKLLNMMNTGSRGQRVVTSQHPGSTVLSEVRDLCCPQASQVWRRGEGRGGQPTKA